MNPGQPGKKIELSPSSTIRELRRMVRDRMEVEPERQVLVYNGQVLVDEHPETKEEMIVTRIVEIKGNVMCSKSMSRIQ